MAQEIYPLSDKGPLLSRNDITEDVFLLSELLFEKSKTSPVKSPLTHEPANLLITPARKPTIALNDRAKGESQLSSHDNSFRKRKRSKNLLLDTTILKTRSSSLS